MSTARTTLSAFLFAATAITAQPLQQYDILQFRQPSGTREEAAEVLTFTTIQGRAFCRFALYRSVASKAANPAEDFRTEWNQLAKIHSPGNPALPPAPQAEQIPNGWTRFDVRLDQQNANLGRYNVRHVVLTGNGRRTSVFAQYNEQSGCVPQVDAFFASLSPIAAPQAPAATTQPAPPPISSSNFQFHTTPFDDGWVATDQPDWVQVVRGNTRVHIHHASPDLRSFRSKIDETSFVWNTLLAPRYTNAANIWIRDRYSLDGPSSPHFAQGDVTDKATGRRVHVALYCAGNNQRWVEIITPSKEAFTKEFTTVFPQDGTNWAPLNALAARNKFAVSARDLTGKWTSSSGAGIQYVNVYTGNSAGMATASSTNEFTFNPDGTYASVYKGVDSFNGSTRYAGENFKGNYIVTDWEIKLTNRFKGRTDVFRAQFEAVKGGRVLHLINPSDGYVYATLIRQR